MAAGDLEKCIDAPKRMDVLTEVCWGLCVVVVVVVVVSIFMDRGVMVMVMG